MKLKDINEKYYFMKNVEYAHQDGWADILDKFCEALLYLFHQEGTDYGFKILQIKEKFGTLVIYHCFEKEAPAQFKYIVDCLVAQIRKESEHVCEKCGKYGKLRDGFWIHVYCDECEEEYKNRFNKKK